MAMAERLVSYDRVNDYSAVTIQLASPNDIRSWSYGEIKKPETINYRTYRPEKDGLFCERIFGPERDWECACGKYRGIKYKDIICDRCGVKITHSKVRRVRMGHINLAAPVVHIWFFRALPSRLGNLLGIKTTALQQVVYFQRYVVIDPGETTLGEKELMTEEQYRNARERFGEAFKAGMGAEAVRELLKDMDLEELSVKLRQELAESKSKQKSEALIKRLRVIEAFIRSPNNPEWMVMDVIPVIPPDLRPLVPLESGNFATSDLNDLYRRVINRNNRLKKLLDLNAPGVIIRNEKRMLQQAVDALFDNGRCKRAVLGAGNRPLKSLTDMIKGKQGRFRENLLGKRVDYSARSVIVVGPELKMNECGLPKKVALELFQPFIIRRLKEKGYADTIKSAKKILERKEEEVWDVLEEVIQGHPVLLNRAPTLHRMGIQAFYPKLVEGDSIVIHPLICAGFNADFDGDQMAVHLPLSLEAQVEASLLLLSTNNIFSPSHGNPVITPDLDIVLGCYFITTAARNDPLAGKAFADTQEVFLALDEGKVGLRTPIKLRLPPNVTVRGADGVEKSPNSIYDTIVGRVIFNDILPEGSDFYNYEMHKKSLNGVVSDCFARAGRGATVRMLDRMKQLGFHYATISGLSFSAHDLRTPPTKEKVIGAAEKSVARIQDNWQRGHITEGERHHQIVDIWTQVRDKVWDELMQTLRYDEREDDPHYVNPIYFMADSGARGSLMQIGQLAGMRGLMAKPSGEFLETPIKSSFREGLRGLEYFSSSHGARKGLADTALKTANSGYLTRKLVEVAQDVVIRMDDCGTTAGVSKGAVYRGDQIELSFADAITGRVARDPVTSILTDEVIVRGNELITREIAGKIEGVLGQDGKIRVRSPLTCEADFGICAKCYGMDLSTGKFVEEGAAAGVIAAQSVGEPGTQLTMRTFHIGGIGIARVEKSEIRAKAEGFARFHSLNIVRNEKGENVVLRRRGELIVEDDKGRELEKHAVPTGAVIPVQERDKIAVGTVLATWDPFMTPILTEVSGNVRFEDIIEDVTMRPEVDRGTGFERKVIMEHRGDHHPQIVIEDENHQILGLYSIPEKAHIEVEEGSPVAAGALLAKTPREMGGSQDITGGLSRVTELFEARKPKSPAVMAEVDGVVELGERKRGKRTIIVRADSGKEYEHLVPQGKHLLVHRGDQVVAGNRLVDGPLIPHDILAISGEEQLQMYLLREVQSVYRSQSVRIDDKHIELLIRQMLRKVRVDDPGDTGLLPTDVVSKGEIRRLNTEALEKGGRPATFSPVLLGIARASLQSDSFVAAASFQETTKVLTEASIAGRRDTLRGLKENVILGHIIPAGVGFQMLQGTLVGREVPAAIEAPAEEGEAPKQLTAGEEAAETPTA
ncbi:MAG: DNA-directed RNA polymerase subunit beta' [Planctomycetota bacterium]|jgi:DNA-directed RNA polymerase subunit beta'